MLQNMVFHRCNRAIGKALAYNSAFSPMLLCGYSGQNAWCLEIMTEYTVITRLLDIGFAIVDGVQSRISVD